MSWRNETWPDTQWLVVSHYERRFMQLVDAVQKDNVRLVAKAFLDSFRAELRVCMGRAQTPVSLKDLLTDDADGDEDGEAMGRVVQRRDLVGNVDFAVHT